MLPAEGEARRGGGGGRGGGGARGGGSRAYRGGHVMNRTPTMSRATSRPAPSRARSLQSGKAAAISQNRLQARPAAGARPAAAARPAGADRTALRSQVSQYAQSRPRQNIDYQAFSQKTKNFSSNRTNQIAQNRQLSTSVSQRLRQSRPDSSRWFDRNFFDRHNLDVDYAGTNANWWRPAAWATLASWGAWSWTTPYYYDEGGYVYPITTDASSYAYPYSPSTESFSQTTAVQGSQATVAEGEGGWLPLGVFAVTSNGHAAAQSHRFIQLAINRTGAIAGVLYNSISDTAQDLTGVIDAASQKAYWSMANKTDSPIASTGMYNLTEDQTPINVHFPDGSDQTWTLVRLQQ